MFKNLGWYVMVFDNKSSEGYVLDRSYNLILKFTDINSKLRFQVQAKCLPSETQHAYEITETPAEFDGRFCTAYWMY